jgi:hypothetical protein
MTLAFHFSIPLYIKTFIHHPLIQHCEELFSEVEQGHRGEIFVRLPTVSG